MGLRKRAGAGGEREDNTAELKTDQLILRHVLSVLRADKDFDPGQETALQARIEATLEAVLDDHRITMSAAEKRLLCQQAEDELVGYGKLGPLLRDKAINNIYVYNPRKVYIERQGQLRLANVHFAEEAELTRIVRRMLESAGAQADEHGLMAHARLPNGWQVGVILPPAAPEGPTLTLRRYSQHRPLSLQDLLGFGSLSAEMAEFLRACAVAGLNMIIGGGRRAGKTTLLNALAAFIPDDERMVVIEHQAELQLQQEHVIRLVCHPPRTHKAVIEVELDQDRVVQLRQRAPAGEGGASASDLLRNVPFLAPERLLVGELRGEEALDFLSAVNSGHDRAMATLYSHSPPDTLHRLEVLSLMGGMALPSRAIREQIASAIDLIVHVERLRDGSRKIVRIAEVQGMEGEHIALADLFAFTPTGLEGGQVTGAFRPTGLRPRNIDRIAEAGIRLPPAIFGLKPHR